MLEVKNMVKTFFKGTINEKTALQGIDLRLEEGDFCTVIGGNGAGKSTSVVYSKILWLVQQVICKLKRI